MKKITLILMSLVLLFALTCTAYAETDDPFEEELLENDLSYLEEPVDSHIPGIEPQVSSSCTLVFKKTSSATAKAQAVASRAGASSITSTIQLQKKSGSSYVNASASPAKKTVSSTQINHTCTFKISSSKTYRIKVTIKYTRSGITQSHTYYRGLSSNGY